MQGINQRQGRSVAVTFPPHAVQAEASSSARLLIELTHTVRQLWVYKGIGLLLGEASCQDFPRAPVQVQAYMCCLLCEQSRVSGGNDGQHL